MHRSFGFMHQKCCNDDVSEYHQYAYEWRHTWNFSSVSAAFKLYNDVCEWMMTMYMSGVTHITSLT